jgi:hypothetical protein
MPAEELEVSTNFNYLSGSAKRRALCIACSYPGSGIALPGTIPDQEAMVHTLSRNGCVRPTLPRFECPDSNGMKMRRRGCARTCAEAECIRAGGDARATGRRPVPSRFSGDAERPEDTLVLSRLSNSQILSLPAGPLLLAP